MRKRAINIKDRSENSYINILENRILDIQKCLFGRTSSNPIHEASIFFAIWVFYCDLLKRSIAGKSNHLNWSSILSSIILKNCFVQINLTISTIYSSSIDSSYQFKLWSNILEHRIYHTKDSSVIAFRTLSKMAICRYYLLQPRCCSLDNCFLYISPKVNFKLYLTKPYKIWLTNNNTIFKRKICKCFRIKICHWSSKIFDFKIFESSQNRIGLNFEYLPRRAIYSFAKYSTTNLKIGLTINIDIKEVMLELLNLKGIEKEDHISFAFNLIVFYIANFQECTSSFCIQLNSLKTRELSNKCFCGSHLNMVSSSSLSVVSMSIGISKNAFAGIAIKNSCKCSCIVFIIRQ